MLGEGAGQGVAAPKDAGSGVALAMTETLRTVLASMTSGLLPPAG